MMMKALFRVIFVQSQQLCILQQMELFNTEYYFCYNFCDVHIERMVASKMRLLMMIKALFRLIFVQSQQLCIIMLTTIITTYIIPLYLS